MGVITMENIKLKTKLTPVRYPGGKSNALQFLSDKYPQNFKEFREPFFGGGSVGLYLMQKNKDADFWINDLFYPVYCFWKVLYERPDDMVKLIRDMKSKYVGSDEKKKVDGKKIRSERAIAGKELHVKCRELIDKTIEGKDEFQTACL